MRNTKPVSEALIQIVNPQYETAEGLVRDPDRLTEPVWACRNNGMSIDVSPSRSMRRAPWGKASHLSVHGLLIGTSEPTHSRRSVADRLALRCRESMTCERAAVQVRISWTDLGVWHQYGASAVRLNHPQWWTGSINPVQ
jgi:hypothetical protein